MGVRGFDPSAVKREHIKPITVLYGGDVPGIEIRIDRFIEVLEKDGSDVRVFRNGRESLGYMTSGDMFSDSICVVIRDLRDLLKSSADAKKDLDVLVSALSSYDSSSVFIIGVPTEKPSQQMNAFMGAVKQMGAMIREVKSPFPKEKVTWAIEYAKSQGKKLSEQSAQKAVDASDGDLEVMQSIIDDMAQELRFMSVEEIRAWLNTSTFATASDFRRAIYQRDVEAVKRIRSGFTPDINGYRTFLLKLRHAVFDVLLISYSKDQNAYVSFKKSQYGSDNVYMSGLASVMNENGRKEQLSYAYKVVNDEIAAISGATERTASYKRVLDSIAACQ